MNQKPGAFATWWIVLEKKNKVPWRNANARHVDVFQNGDGVGDSHREGDKECDDDDSDIDDDDGDDVCEV